MINLSIDGKSIQVPEGTTVLRAAEQAGIDIPTLCDHPELTPYGGCRLCVVEVEGAKALQPSCTLPVSENMVVRTDTERIQEARKFVLTMIFSERNHFCPYCQVSGGDCELQNAAYGQGMTHWDLQPNWQQFPVDASHPYFILDHNRCILCRRCVRACAELVGNFTLGFEERGAKSFLVADLGVPLGESTCVSCGTCVQVCPTGAIIDRESAYIGKETEVEHNKTICVGCSIGCGIDVQTRDNRLVRIEGDWDSTINSGVICEIGRFYPLKDDRERILTPLHKKNGELKAINWEEAFSIAINLIKENKSKKNLAIASNRLPADDLYAFEEIFKKHLGFDAVTSTENGSTTSLVRKFSQASQSVFKSNLESIEESDCIITLDANLYDDHQVAGFFVKRNLPGGCKLISIETRETAINEITGYNVTIDKKKCGDLLDFIISVSNELSKSGNEEDLAKLNGPDLSKYDISMDKLIDIATSISSSKNPMIIFGGCFAEMENAFDAMINFANHFEIVSKKRSNILSLFGGANSLTSSLLNFDEEIAKCDHDLLLALIADENPSEKLLSQTENSKKMIVCSSHYNKLTSKADLVLPVVTWLETEGQYINLEGKIQNLTKSIKGPDNVKSIAEILDIVANSAGCKLDKKNWVKEIKQAKSPVEIID